MKQCLKLAFGAPAQVAVAFLLVLATTVQTVWVFATSFPPSNAWIFAVSMEALYFAAYGVAAAAFAVMWLDERTPSA